MAALSSVSLRYAGSFGLSVANAASRKSTCCFVRVAAGMAAVERTLLMEIMAGTVACSLVYDLRAAHCSPLKPVAEAATLDWGAADTVEMKVRKEMTGMEMADFIVMDDLG